MADTVSPCCCIVGCCDTATERSSAVAAADTHTEDPPRLDATRYSTVASLALVALLARLFHTGDRTPANAMPPKLPAP
jgi:hypothetical protein